MSMSQPTLADLADSRPRLTPTDIAQFVSKAECPRLFEFQSAAFREQHSAEYSYPTPYDPVSPVLAADGLAFEETVEQRFKQGAAMVIERDDATDIQAKSMSERWENSCTRIQTALVEYLTASDPSGHLLITQPYLGPQIGPWPVSGRADMLLVWRSDATDTVPPDTGYQSVDEGPHLRFCVVDAKATTEEKTHHQVQVAVYARLLRQLLAELPSAEVVSASNAGDKRVTETTSHTAVQEAIIPEACATRPDSADTGQTYTWDITGSVVTREAGLNLPPQEPITSTPVASAAEPICLDDLPTFTLADREQDITQLLKKGGRFDTLWRRALGETRYSITGKCASCDHREACITAATEDSDLALLGLSSREQAVLADHGITTIEDLANIAYSVGDTRPDGDPKPDIKLQYEDTYAALMADMSLASSLHRYIAEAQAHAGQVDGTAVSGPNVTPPTEVPGSDTLSLPEDDPPFQLNDEQLPFSRGELIRVYLTPHVDPRFSRLALISYTITATALPKDADISGVVSRETFPDTPEEATDAEASLLTTVARHLNAGIESAATTLDVDARPLHFYTYTDQSATSFERAVVRHREASQELAALSDIIQHRDGIEGAMLTPVEPAAQTQLATGLPSSGLLQLWEQTFPYDAEEALAPHTLSHERTSGTEISLQRAFQFKLFDYQAPYVATSEEVQLHPPSQSRDAIDGRMSLWETPTHAVPIEYLAAAQGYLSESFAAELTDAYETTPPIRPYQYVDATAESPKRIRMSDVKAMASALTDALRHVEQSLSHKQVPISKPTYEPPALATGSFGDTTITDAAIEYLQLEHASSQAALDDHFSQPVRGRVASGRSIPVVVTDARVEDGQLIVDGVPGYNAFFDTEQEAARVASACRHAGDKQSWLVANPLEAGSGDAIETQAYRLKQGVSVTLTKFDLDEGHIQFTALPSYVTQSTSQFTIQHNKWTTDPTKAAQDDDTVLFEYNTPFILDPQPDDITGERLYNALGDADDPGTVGRLIETMTDTQSPPTVPTTDRFPPATAEQFADWYDRHGPTAFTLNDAQRQFITETTSQLVGLQGPPGTGKTSGALAPALLARLFAAGKHGNTAIGVVVAESNQAVDEALADTTEVYQAYTDSLHDGGGERHATPEGATEAVATVNDSFPVTLARLTSRLPSEGDREPGVTYLTGRDAAGDKQITYAELAAQLRNHRYSQQTLSATSQTETQTTPADAQTEPLTPSQASPTSQATLPGQDTSPETSSNGPEIATSDSPTPDPATPSAATDATGSSGRPHTLLFTTPAQLYKLLDDVSTDEAPSDLLDDQAAFFDFVAFDEASMADLSSVLFAGGYLRPDGQLLLAGDHRQMPPVQQRDWSAETRRTVLEHGGHLSALNYLRLLRGELDLDTVDHTDPEDIRPALRDVDYDIPFVRLPEGFRSHTHVTDFLQSHIYEQDAIDYATQLTTLSSPPSPSTTGSRAALAPQAPLTVLVHSDTTSRQANHTEAAICHTLATDRNPDESFGIVTPHNAQRGLLTTALTDADVDTVERYQGDDRDMIAVSATAADPQFLHTESDFILNPNRLTVAMSRMKHKLLVTASETVFNLIPDSPTTYDRAHIWKSLYRECGVPTTEPIWHGSVSDFCNQDTHASDITIPDETTVSIYHYQP